MIFLFLTPVSNCASCDRTFQAKLPCYWSKGENETFLWRNLFLQAKGIKTKSEIAARASGERPLNASKYAQYNYMFNFLWQLDWWLQDDLNSKRRFLPHQRWKVNATFTLLRCQSQRIHHRNWTGSWTNWKENGVCSLSIEFRKLWFIQTRISFKN